MARMPRVEFPGASYHVMARGNERQRIYRSESDYLLFLKTLGESLEPFGGQVHAWCLLPNHYHLALTTPQGNLSRWIGWLQTTFTARYNRRHRRVGHLFQGRFKAELVDTDHYAKTLIGYIHFNPIRSKRSGKRQFIGGMKELNAYRWSSHPDYMALRSKPLLAWDRSWLSHWGNTTGQSRRSYKKWMLESLGRCPEDWSDCVRHGLVAGGEEMVEKVLQLVRGKADKISKSWGFQARQSAGKIRMEAALKNETNTDLALWVRRRLLGERAVDLAAEYGYANGSGVTHAVNRIENKAQADQSIRKAMETYREF